MSKKKKRTPATPGSTTSEAEATEDAAEPAGAITDEAEVDTKANPEAGADEDKAEKGTDNPEENDKLPPVSGIERVLQHPAALGVVLLVLAGILLIRISSFGIWDPWELNAADAARDLLEGNDVADRRSSLSTLLISWSFGAFGISEAAGRLPMAIGGLLTALVAWWLGRRYGDARTGLIAALVAGSTPLFLFNSRQMLGESLSFMASGLVGALAIGLAFDPPRDTRKLALWGGGLVLSIFLGVAAGGGLLVVLPPLGAVTGAMLLRGVVPAERTRRIGAGVVLFLGVYVALRVVSAVVADEATFSPWLGGAPRGGEPPTFDAGLETVFHSFAPWSAIGLLALVRMLGPIDADKPTERRRLRDARLSLVLWAAFSYGALTLYTARYGPATYMAVVPLAAAIAFYLRDIEKSERTWWPDAIIGALLVGLLVRDYALYPGSPIAGLPVEGIEVPEGADNPKRFWAGVLGLVMIGLVLGLGTKGRADRMPDLKAVPMFLRGQWKKGLIFKIWLSLAALLMGLLLILGAVAWVSSGSLPVTSVVIRALRAMTFAPIALPVVAVVTPWVFWAFDKLGRYRLLPLMGAGLIFSLYASQLFLPQLSSHFSPREVYDTYNELRGEGEPLAEFRVSGRAAAYYAVGEIQDLESQQELMEFLSSPERHWAVIPADDLAGLNREFRTRNGRHLFVADARSARVLLVTNQSIEGRDNENFVAEAVLDAVPPDIQHRVGGMFDDRIELVGFDLDLPQEGYVGPGQAFKVRWYWKCHRRVPGAYKIFLHVDGAGNRLNGDHEAVDERYPVRLWEEGDIVVDEQELRVPANYRPGRYNFWIGFYSGTNRLDVTRGDEDSSNRLNAGTLFIR